MCINSLACVRVKGGEKECFRSESVETRCYHVLLIFQWVAVMKVGMRRMGVRFLKEGRKERLPGL